MSLQRKYRVVAGRRRRDSGRKGFLTIVASFPTSKLERKPYSIPFLPQAGNRAASSFFPSSRSSSYAVLYITSKSPVPPPARKSGSRWVAFRRIEYRFHASIIDLAASPRRFHIYVIAFLALGRDTEFGLPLHLVSVIHKPNGPLASFLFSGLGPPLYYLTALCSILHPAAPTCALLDTLRNPGISTRNSSLLLAISAVVSSRWLPYRTGSLPLVGGSRVFSHPDLRLSVYRPDHPGSPPSKCSAFEPSAWWCSSSPHSRSAPGSRPGPSIPSRRVRRSGRKTRLGCRHRRIGSTVRLAGGWDCAVCTTSGLIRPSSLGMRPGSRVRSPTATMSPRAAIGDSSCGRCRCWTT